MSQENDPANISGTLEAATAAHPASDYQHSLLIDATPEATYRAVLAVGDWWTKDLSGNTTALGDEFTVRFGATWITLKVTELVPFERIAWLVTDCFKHYLQDKKEWVGTSIAWNLRAEGGSTRLRLTHVGLVPGLECYEGCKTVWGQYLHDSLLNLASNGIRNVR